MTLATLLTAFVMVAFIAYLVRRDWTSNLVSSIIMVVLAYGAGQTAIALMGGSTKALHGAAAAMSSELLLALFVYAALGGFVPKTTFLLELLIVGAMAGALDTRATDLSTPGAQPQMYNSNILLIVLSALLLIAYAFVAIQNKRAKQRNAVQAHRDAAYAVQSPMDCTSTYDQPITNPVDPFKKQL